MRSFIRWLVGASVRRTLTLGVSTVLVLGLLVTGIALHSLDQLTARSESLVASVSLNTQINAVRLRENEFDRTGQASAVAGYADEMQALNDRVKGLRSSLESDAQGSLARISEVAETYRQSFAAFVAAHAQAVTAENAMAPVIEQIAGNLQKVNAGLFDQLRHDPTQSPDSLQAAVALQALMAHLREQVQTYLATPDASGEQAVSKTVDVLRLQGNELYAQLSSEALQGVLLEALQAVVTYQDRVHDFRDSVAKSQEAKQAMLAQAMELQRLSAMVYQQQLQGRSREVALANEELLVAQTLALLLGVLAAWAMTRQIVPPLKRTLEMARQIAAGDLTGNLDSDRHDELGQMMAAMREMADHLRQLIGRIGDGTRQLSTEAAGLSTVTAQGSAGVARQRQQTEEVATAMNEMVASAQHVAHNAQQASDAAAGAEQKSVAGNRMVASAIQRFEALVVNVERSGEAMARLRADGERIGGVLSVIREVADQTNLLALNAAIEAARAGEAGRGFAVVADEVRNLAKRTRQSTEEIEALVGALHSGTEQATDLMNDSEAMSLSSVELAREAGQVLEDIRQSVSLILGMNAEIASAAQQQTRASEQISQNLDRVSDIADESADSSARTAAASLELSRLGGDLNQLVERFRLV